MDRNADLAGFVFLVRIAERVTLSIVVVLVAFVVTLAFWRSVQRIDFNLGQGGISAGAKVMVATPVLALAALIGFAWVSFSNPITVSGTTAVRTAPTEGIAETAGYTLSGMTPGRRDAPPPDPSRDREIARDRILYLNCLAALPGASSPDDAGDLLPALRLELMLPVWGSDWGTAEAFADWANGKDPGPPNFAAQAFFEEVSPTCPAKP